MKKVIIVTLLLLAAVAFGAPEFPKEEEIDWIRSYTPKEFETLCVEHQDDSPFTSLLYPRKEQLTDVMEQFPEVDQIREWKVKDSAYEENGKIWINGWAIFSKDQLVKLYPLNTTYKATKTI
ncbi:hypothetical protein [Pelagicoccus sp. SDUM812005]|uniref:hypothetical protein n=1 Tax=Pelagicoccus sp. SDUM812005 TaxID=3041257 RepID=UPI00280EA2EF|nr:hypothetical protein [Pelagicoccus sp. SDUM812005]MDQ8183881.1 hypothetical protein [Pelagicoccus sp. SDUM812005]